MSRICVKNLSKYATEDRLREFFSQKGEVTDAKLIRCQDGKSRNFGYIGFRTEEEAQEAIKYFNNSYLDTSRITCEIAYRAGDSNLPQPWSRHSIKKRKDTESSDNITQKEDRKTSRRKINDIRTNNENNDPQFQEFLQAMQPTKLWSNDTPLLAPVVEQRGEGSDRKKKKKKVGEDSTKVPTELLQNKKIENGSVPNQAAEDSDSIRNDESVMDYFKSRVKKDWSDSESDDESDNDDNNGNNFSKKRDKIQDAQEIGIKGQHDDFERGPAEDDAEDGSLGDIDHEMFNSDNPSSTLDDGEKEILASGRLFLRNLPYIATEEELEEHFSKIGSVSEVHLVVDKETKRSKGIAYVRYSSPECALRAFRELDNSTFQGRLLHIMPAKEKSPSERQNANANETSKTLKQKRMDERKASEAGGNTQAWNSLFMRPDTVVENIARRYGVSKSDFLDKEAEGLAVSIALGETQVIAETKKALANAGVNIGLLEEYANKKTDDMKRSHHVILVKNLPYSSSEDELAKIFGKFGSLDKIILPPTKTLALASFLEPSEARTAFKCLAYTRYKDGPLYLEWAPEDIFSQNAAALNDGNDTAVVSDHEVKRVLLKQQVEGVADADDIDTDRVESRSLFVKNLSFNTSDESLRKHFSDRIKDGKILSVRVKKHEKNGKILSAGFGFMEFDSVETALNVCKDLQGTVLDGFALILQLCHAKKDEKVSKSVGQDQSSTKIMARNIAFEATEKELRQLFSPFGQIKSLRLPMRYGKHRGFAFVEYVTKQEAKKALEALANTHLYGRHLVLERAKEGETLEELRARTAAQFKDGENALNPAKVSKKRKNMDMIDEGGF